MNWKKKCIVCLDVKCKYFQLPLDIVYLQNKIEFYLDCFHILFKFWLQSLSLKWILFMNFTLLYIPIVLCTLSKIINCDLNSKQKRNEQKNDDKPAEHFGFYWYPFKLIYRHIWLGYHHYSINRTITIVSIENMMGND